jgi:hypothetical protein
VLDVRFKSFITQVLVFPGDEITVLLNKFHPWVGFCQLREPGNCWLEFVDRDQVGALFAALGKYRVLSRAELDQPVTKAMCAELRYAELQQLKYWSKGSERGKFRVGEVVFNFWD